MNVSELLERRQVDTDNHSDDGKRNQQLAPGEALVFHNRSQMADNTAGVA